MIKDLPPLFFNRFQKELFEAVMESVRPGIALRRKDDGSVHVVLCSMVEPHYETLDQWNCNKEIQGTDQMEVKWFQLSLFMINEDSERRIHRISFSNDMQMKTWLVTIKKAYETLYEP